MTHNRKICVVTGTRAEYGLLQGIMRKIHEDPDVTLQVIVTGTHLVPEYGLTYQTIEADGFPIDDKIDIVLASGSSVSITKSIGLAVIGFADSFAKLTPDILVLLGDRYELLAAAQAALIARIPIAHIHGGEITEGAVDDAIRHAITKMAHLHFAATKSYGKRIVQLGEKPANVYIVGAPGLDGIKNLPLLDRSALTNSLSFDLSGPFLLMTYHPVTLAKRDEIAVLEEVLAAIDAFPKHKIIITYPNADAYGRHIIMRLEDYAAQNTGHVFLIHSLGRIRYLSAAKLADAVIGNSSSGIIEVPSLGTPTVNIGPRQKGREAALSVIHCEETYESTRKGIEQALSEQYQSAAKDVRNPYADGNAASKIVTILKDASLEGLLMKSFFNIDFDLNEGT